MHWTVIDTSVFCYRLMSSLSCFIDASPLAQGSVRASALPYFKAAVRKSIYALEADAREGRIIWIGDGSHYFRKEICPEYKSNRTPKPDAYFTALKEVFETVEVFVGKCEADDAIAAFCLNHVQLNNDSATIWTVDGDLMQLITPQVEWRNMASCEPRLRTWGDWQEWFAKRKIPKKHWAKANSPHEAVCTYKYNLGDKADNYPKHMPQPMYDLTVAPAVTEFGPTFWTSQVIDKYTYTVDQAKGEAAITSLDKAGLKPGHWEPRFYEPALGWAA